MEPSSVPFKFSNLEIKSIVAKEESGDRIYEVLDRSTGATYALKQFSRRYEVNERENTRQEIQVLKTLHHPNLVKCHELFETDDDSMYLLFEHMDLGSLMGADVKDESSLASIARQVLAGVEYLHGKGVSHGDIKTSNVFVNSSKQVKLLYMGKILSQTPTLSRVGEGVGGVYDEFSWDVWSVGLTLLKLYKGSTWAYRDSDFGGKVESLQKSSKDVWSFLLCCMRTDLSKRWSLEKLIRHPFLLQQGSSSLLPRERYLSARSSESPSVRVKAAVPEFGLCESQGGLLAPLPEGALFPNFELEVDISPEFDLWNDISAGFLSMSESGITQSSRGEQDTGPPKKKTKLKAAVNAISFINAISNVGSSNDRSSIKNPQRPQDYVRCIQHCYLFPEDVEFGKDKLIQLWIAEECMEWKVSERVEDAASLYFDALVNEEFIVPIKFDNLYGQMKYKVNASKTSWSDTHVEYLRINDGKFGDLRSVLHLSLHGKKVDQTVFHALKNLKQLHTLLMLGSGNSLIKQIPNDFFLGFKLLKTLDLSFSHVSDLPSSVGNLQSLRYLDISETPIKLLPESTDRLHFLQTLRLRGCFRLHALPREMRNLVNLRHLDLDIVQQLKTMPKGMGNLTKLQTLRGFLVGKHDEYSITELQNMNDITGSFCISRLENVSNAEEAKQAAMDKKKHISKLELRWNDHTIENSQIQVEILECLQPHFGLKELQILFYSGPVLPCWITSPSFTNLESITLYKCINCHILPSIGELPSLRFLSIVGMDSLRDINSLFCRMQGSLGGNAFPRLEKLTLDNMLNLEKWTGLQDGDFSRLNHITIRYCPKLACIPILSRLDTLLHLEISHCMQLTLLPDRGLPNSLKSLIIRDCPKISEYSLQDEGQDWFKTAKLRKIWIDFKEISLDEGS